MTNNLGNISAGNKYMLLLISFAKWKISEQCCIKGTAKDTSFDEKSISYKTYQQ